MIRHKQFMTNVCYVKTLHMRAVFTINWHMVWTSRHKPCLLLNASQTIWCAAKIGGPWDCSPKRWSQNGNSRFATCPIVKHGPPLGYQNRRYRIPKLYKDSFDVITQRKVDKFWRLLIAEDVRRERPFQIKEIPMGVWDGETKADKASPDETSSSYSQSDVFVILRWQVYICCGRI